MAFRELPPGSRLGGSDRGTLRCRRHVALDYRSHRTEALERDAADLLRPAMLEQHRAREDDVSSGRGTEVASPVADQHSDRPAGRRTEGLALAKRRAAIGAPAGVGEIEGNDAVQPHLEPARPHRRDGDALAREQVMNHSVDAFAGNAQGDATAGAPG